MKVDLLALTRGAFECVTHDFILDAKGHECRRCGIREEIIHGQKYVIDPPNARGRNPSKAVRRYGGQNRQRAMSVQDQKTPEKPKASERDTIRRRELDRIARQLEGLSKAVKRLKEAT